MSEHVWMRPPHGGRAHAVVNGKAACGRRLDWTTEGVSAVGRCRRCAAAVAGPFGTSEAELSEEAQAILAYARKWGKPFTRHEITDIAPGAAWDEYSRYPKTVAELDPIRELARAGLVEEHDEQSVKGRRGRTYKRWALTGEAPLSLAELLDAFAAWHAGGGPAERGGEIRDEILRRFDRG